MKNNYARIVFILDRSGSMDGMRREAIDGYNGFLRDQKQVPGEADIQLVLFNEVRIPHPAQNLTEARELNENLYTPYGMTALYDAVGFTIEEVGKALKETAEKARPSKVIFAILTDGQENSSKTYRGEEGRQRLAEMIKHQQEVYGWEFSFLGANMDAPAMAVSLNIPVMNAANFMPDARGLETAYATTTSNVSRMRTGG